MGFASSSSSGGAAAEGSAETNLNQTFNNQTEQVHGNANASNWHQANHQAQAYINSQYPNGFFNQVLLLVRFIRFKRMLMLIDLLCFVE